MTKSLPKSILMHATPNSCCRFFFLHISVLSLMSSWGEVAAPVVPSRTSNPIRAIVDRMAIQPPAGVQVIPLSIGDPTTDGNLLPPPNVTAKIQELVASNKFNGYPPSVGYPFARDAVARKFTTDACPLTADDVVLASGASQALELSIGALTNEGDNILLPTPGFSLYKTICDSRGVEQKYYMCDPNRGWECDLEGMEKLIDSKTKAILINNPSNPCGSNFSKEHLMSILAIAERHKVPIISDEIYADMSFNSPFFSAAALAANVPCLVIGGIAKQFVVPGWRLGWVIVHDPVKAFGSVRRSLAALSTLILGPNSIIQAALEEMLHNTPKTYLDDLMRTLSDNAAFSFQQVSAIPMLQPVRPDAAMYMMVGINFDKVHPSHNITDEVEFAKALMRDQGVQVLPGSCFRMPKFFRIVFTKPKEQLQEAFGRIAKFCDAVAQPAK